MRCAAQAQARLLAPGPNDATPDLEIAPRWARGHTPSDQRTNRGGFSGCQGKLLAARWQPPAREARAPARSVGARRGGRHRTVTAAGLGGGGRVRLPYALPAPPVPTRASPSPRRSPRRPRRPRPWKSPRLRVCRCPADGRGRGLGAWRPSPGARGRGLTGAALRVKDEGLE